MKKKLPIYAERSIAVLQTEMIDRSTAFRMKLPTVACKTGCSNCCKHPVYISIIEGLLLYRWLADHGHWTPSFRKRLVDHAERTWDLSPAVWLLSAIPCPLLEADKCQAYNVRPFFCRITFSTGDPKFCHPHEIGTETRIPPRDAVLTSFLEFEEKLLKQHGVNFTVMSVSKAILFAEKIVLGSTDLERINFLMLKDLLEGLPPT